MSSKKGHLSSCPRCSIFAGSHTISMGYNGSMYWILCEGCGRKTKKHKTRSEVKLEWNTRAGEKV